MVFLTCIAFHLMIPSQDHIFGPLGMTSVSFYLTPALKERLLPLSYRNKSGVIERWKGSPVIDQDPAHGIFF
jgi:CubicO group peptidase (beta-lactamase class C family)